MTHELINIVENAVLASNKGLKSVLATVVDLDGSSYRKPGVRMLILEDSTMIGAVSGGCVEKEILLQSESVFKSGIAKMMTYDGRYRLGCEGVLYILLEPFTPHKDFFEAFSSCITKRLPIELTSYYFKNEIESSMMGSYVTVSNESFAINKNIDKEKSSELLTFNQTLPPRFKLVIIGAEHDAVQLCRYAALTGWEVNVVAGVSEAKAIKNFPGAQALLQSTAETFDTSLIDNQTAIVLMTHNFANDLRFLVALHETRPNYLGVLGPSKRREDLLTRLIDYCPEISDEFLELIHGPAGLDIGSITPQEIAISIISEILAFTRKRNPKSLNNIKGSIHSKYQ